MASPVQAEGEGRYLVDPSGFVYGWNRAMAMDRSNYAESDQSGNPLPADQQTQVQENTAFSGRIELTNEPNSSLATALRPMPPVSPPASYEEAVRLRSQAPHDYWPKGDLELFRKDPAKFKQEQEQQRKEFETQQREATQAEARSMRDRTPQDRRAPVAPPVPPAPSAENTSASASNKSSK